MNYAETTVCRADEVQPGEVLVRIGELEYPDGLRLRAAPVRADGPGVPFADRPGVFLPLEGRAGMTVPADQFVWVFG